MAGLDQSTRRGRLIAVFVGGIIIFGGITLAGLYMSHQRQAQFEAAQEGSSQITSEETSHNEEVASDFTEEEKKEDEQGSQSEDESSQDDTAAGSDDTEATDDEPYTVVATGPSSSDSETEDEETLPATGPSDTTDEGSPTEIPATGPEVVWIVTLAGAMAALYVGFEYRRSRLAFRRAAMHRD